MPDYTPLLHYHSSNRASITKLQVFWRFGNGQSVSTSIRYSIERLRCTCKTLIAKWYANVGILLHKFFDQFALRFARHNARMHSQKVLYCIVNSVGKRRVLWKFMGLNTKEQDELAEFATRLLLSPTSAQAITKMVVV
jgi:hypothetical protein